MGFNEHGSNTDGNRGTGQNRRIFPLSARGSALPAGLLNRMSGIKDNRTSGVLSHFRQPAKIGYQRIVAETGSAIGQTDVHISGIFNFLRDVFHIPRSAELAFFYINDLSGFGSGDQQISLPT